MNWSYRHTVIAGFALIAVTNAIALGGVAWNRSGTPESVLQLTERELWSPYGYGLDRESGGLQLVLRWRVLTDDPHLMGYEGAYNSPDWLDREKLAALGFDVSQPKQRQGRRSYRDRTLPRGALIVLELNGPTYPKAVKLARLHAEKEAALAAAPAPKPGAGERAKSAAEALKREQTSNSRLFAVDVGLDPVALRAKYPDRNRYAIVTGKVRAAYDQDKKIWRGYIAEILNTRVNVPLDLMPPMGSVPRVRPWMGAPKPGPAFHATVAFGNRYEPWLMDVQQGGAAAGAGR